MVADELQATKVDEATSPTASRTTTLRTRMNPPSASHRPSGVADVVLHAINSCAIGAGINCKFRDRSSKRHALLHQRTPWNANAGGLLKSTFRLGDVATARCSDRSTIPPGNY